MARYREASPADVRQWAYDTNWTDSGGNGVGERGRFSSELITAFNDANRKNYLRYSGGTPQGQVAQTRQPARQPAQVATRTQSRSGNPPATRRAPRATARATAPARDIPAPRPVESVPARVIHDEEGALEMVREVMEQLSAAGAVEGGGDAILMHVEGWRLATAS